MPARMSTRAYVQAGRRPPAHRPEPVFVDDSRVRRVRRALVSEDAALSLAETFSLLGDPTRTRILHALSVDELCVSDLAGLLGISPSAASHQLRLLRNRRLVAVRREGKHTYYRLEDEHIRTLVDMGLSHAQEDGLLRRRRH
jgi:ArsR family transcriptional regulator, lead/cadmium/zinc/bismuth-responsive transcriptional repressor